MPTGISTFNKFGIGAPVGTDEVVILRPIPQRLTREDAIILAAHLVTVADLGGERFDEYLQELLNV